MKKVNVALFLVLFAVIAYPQTRPSIQTGVVYDSISQEPLPFVNVFNSRRSIYSTCGVDGKFSIEADQGDWLVFSYVGYKSARFVVTNAKRIEIALTMDVSELQAIEVVAGENPAFSIIRKTIANKSKNDPENLQSFSYKAYHKFYATTEGTFDTAQLKTQGGKFLSTHHLFINETISERKVLKPNHDEETVLANRMSGVKDPFFAILATNFQPFTFYKDHLELLGKNFVNPIAAGTFDRYDFELEDTLATPSDTTFIISFQPRPGKTFEALKGVLYISTNGYAIEHVLAEPADPKALTKIKIQQKYVPVSGAWFPSQLNTEFLLSEMQIVKHPVKYVHRSYLSEQQINPTLTKKQFGELNLVFAPDANRQDEAKWNTARLDTLSFKEKNTYHFYDTIPARRLQVLNTVIKLGESFASGKFRYKNFYFPLTHLLKVNNYEDYRFGIGIETSEGISKWFNLDGFVGYGVKDKALKYGGGVRFNIARRNDISLKFSYSRDLQEPGSSSFIPGASSLSGSDRLRSWLASRMDSVQRFHVALHLRPFTFGEVVVFSSIENRNPTYRYRYSLNDGTTFTTFDIHETGFLFRYSFGEHYTQLRNTRIITAYKYPQINIRASYFIDRMNASIRFLKAEGKIDHEFLFRGMGKTNLEIHAGAVDGRAPYPYLFNGRGTSTPDFKLSGFFVPNYFQTMGLYEFVSDRFVNLFIKHHFGRIVGTRYRYFRPELSLIQHTGIGWLSHPEIQQDVVMQSYDKGFLESGIAIDNLVRFRYVDIAYIGLGAAGFYRYGPYGNADATDNIAVRISVNFSF